MNKVSDTKKILIPLVFAAGGGILGWLYYLLLGEADGNSFLSAGPLVSVVYFAVLGILIYVFLSEMKKSRKKENKDHPH